MLYQVTHSPLRLTVSQKCREEGAGKKISSAVWFFPHLGLCALATMGIGYRSDSGLCKADVIVNCNICKSCSITSYKPFFKMILTCIFIEYFRLYSSASFLFCCWVVIQRLKSSVTRQQDSALDYCKFLFTANTDVSE